MLRRTAIRRVVIEILSDPKTALRTGSCKTGLTAAEDRVLDSHSDPLQLINGSDVELPAIAVYTDSEDGDFGGGMPADPGSHNDLVIHIEMFASTSTDFATEALLDDMEEQVRRKVLWDDRLYRRPVVDAEGTVRGWEPLVMSVSKFQSTRALDSERQARVGMRRLSLTVHYVDNCLPPEIVVDGPLAPPTFECMKAGVQIGENLVQFKPKHR
ncbi:hypothetical protein [Paraburkholderia sp. UCT2]|uniref:hypothetical protein n=1 Tax=Paraburkholderia sp. UCT2 TaxID=2615208 RepID=UPI00165650A3|nr:hypothetical protein [Paraburkholderia sp. UCT2]MBC8729988.1 hypothetical protein [Paraburkholderia sp. UCT2]